MRPRCPEAPKSLVKTGWQAVSDSGNEKPSPGGPHYRQFLRLHKISAARSREAQAKVAASCAGSDMTVHQVARQVASERPLVLAGNDAFMVSL